LDDNVSWKSSSVVMTSVVLVLAFLAGTYIQFELLEKLKLVVLTTMDNVSADTLAKGAFIRIAVKALGPLDWAVTGACVLLLVSFILLQAKRGAVSSFFEFMLADERRTLFFLLFLSALFFKPILAPGAPYFMDAPAHVSRAWFAYVNLAQGYLFPSFTNYYHNGFALFSHYGWLPSYLIALVNLAVQNINAASKLTEFLFSVANTFLFYALGKTVFSSRRGGLLLALIILSSNLYLYEIMWTGAIFYPWVFLGAGVMLFSFESWFCGRWKFFPAAFATALGSAILINSHLGYSAQFLLFFAVYAIARTAIFQRRRFAAFLRFAAASACIGAVLGAFVFLPTWRDIGDVNFYKAFPFSDPLTYQFWRAPIWQFLVPRPFYTGLNWDYMGLALLAASAVFTVRFLKERHPWFAFSLVLIGFSVLVISYNRNSVLVLFALAFLVAGGYVHLIRKGDAKLRGFAILAMALMVDALLFNNFNTTDTRGSFEKAVYTRLTSEPDGSRYGVVMANTLHTGNDTGNDVFVSPWLKVVGQTVLQPNAIMLEANKQALYQYGFTSDLLVPDVKDGHLSPTTVQALDLIGVKYLTFHNVSQYFVPSLTFDESARPRTDGPWVEMPLTSPVLFAPATVNVADLEQAIPDLKRRAAFESDDLSHNRAPFKKRPDADAYLRAIVAATGLDPVTANARQFLIRSGSGEDLGGGSPANVSVTRFDVDSQKVVLDFAVDRKGFIAVPFGYFRWHKVLLDGKPAKFLPTVENTICLRIDEPGRHTLSIGPSLSPARRIGAIISLAGLAIFMIIFLVLRVRRRRA
jgi:hypothetical protein